MLEALETTHPVMALRNYLVIPSLYTHPRAYVGLEGKIDQLFGFSVDHKYRVRSGKGEYLSRVIFSDGFAPIAPVRGIDIPAILLDVMGIKPTDNPLLLTPTDQENAIRFAAEYISGVDPDVISKVLKYSPRSYADMHTSLGKYTPQQEEVWVNTKVANVLENDQQGHPFRSLGELYDAILDQRIPQAA